MRNFIIGVIAAAALYFLCTHQDLWTGYIPFLHKKEEQKYTEQKETYAWKMFLREGDGSYTVRALLIDGSRWRVESRKMGSSKTQVAVCDGKQTVASPPMGSTAMLDPRPQVNQLLAGAATLSDQAAQNSSQETEERDGHTCWKTALKMQALDTEIWVDSTSALPVCVEMAIMNMHVDIHIEPMQVNFEKDGARYFDAGNTAPAFADELTDDANKERVSHFSLENMADRHASAGGQGPASTTAAPQVPAQPGRMVLKEAVAVTSFYGAMTIPANTEVRILKQTAQGYHVSAGGQEFDVRADQVGSAP